MKLVFKQNFIDLYKKKSFTIKNKIVMKNASKLVRIINKHSNMIGKPNNAAPRQQTKQRHSLRLRNRKREKTTKEKSHLYQNHLFR
jgi:hypothetical protein